MKKNKKIALVWIIFFYLNFIFNIKFQI